jgi:hypothetical protein
MLFIHPLSTNSGRSHFSIPPVVVYNRRKKDADVHWCIAKSQHIRLVSLPIYIFLFFGIIFNIFGLCSSFPIIREECSPPQNTAVEIYTYVTQQQSTGTCINVCQSAYIEGINHQWKRERLVALFYLYETTSGSLNQSKAFGRGILSTLRVMLA